jgi:hypothetical protein
MMEQLAERRMQREEDAAGAIEAESDEESEDDGDGSERDDEGDDEGVSEDEEEDEEDGEEEVLIPSFLPLFTQLIIFFLSRRCPRNKRWRRVNECFPSLLHACSNNVYCKRTERKSLRNVSYSFSANLTTKTRLPRIVR